MPWSYGRREKLEAYAASKGVSASDVDTQIEFLISELTPGGAGPAQGYATYQLVSYNGYNGDMWKNATSQKKQLQHFVGHLKDRVHQTLQQDKKVLDNTTIYMQVEEQAVQTNLYTKCML